MVSAGRGRPSPGRVVLEPIPWEGVPWETLDACPDRTVFQTKPWLEFLAETQAATPVIAAVVVGGAIQGYFSGLTFRKFGLKFLGSSFPGWATPHIGFNMLPGAERIDPLEALADLAFRRLGCVHLEVSDRARQLPEDPDPPYRPSAFRTLVTDLRPPLDAIEQSLDQDVRRRIRKATRDGVTVVTCTDPEFPLRYHAQLVDVFARQGMSPPYQAGRVIALQRHLGGTPSLLLQEARNAAGEVLATTITLGFNRLAHFWGMASWRAAQKQSPNEILYWAAMQYWKDQGCHSIDWGGFASYKLKYACHPVDIPWVQWPRYRFLLHGRTLLHRLQRQRQRLAHLRSRRGAQ